MKKILTCVLALVLCAGLGYDVVGANAQFWTTKDIYRVNWAFVIIAIIISLVLLVLGFLGIYLRHVISHPDILGYQTKVNRYQPFVTARLMG